MKKKCLFKYWYVPSMFHCLIPFTCLEESSIYPSVLFYSHTAMGVTCFFLRCRTKSPRSMVMQLYFCQAGKVKSWGLEELNENDIGDTFYGKLIQSENGHFSFAHTTSLNHPFWILIDSCKSMKDQIFQDEDSKILLRCFTWLIGHWYPAILLL